MDNIDYGVLKIHKIHELVRRYLYHCRRDHETRKDRKQKSAYYEDIPVGLRILVDLNKASLVLLLTLDKHDDQRNDKRETYRGKSQSS